MAKKTKKPEATDRKPRGLPPLRVGLLMGHDEIKGLVANRVAEEFQRMQALADSLGIADDGNRWYRLALHLARLHIPELREATPQGAPRKWGDFELAVLAVEIERITVTGKTVEQAAKTLAHREPWAEFVGSKTGTYFGPDPVAALQRQYANALNVKLTKIARIAFQAHQHEGNVDEWERDHVGSVGKN